MNHNNLYDDPDNHKPDRSHVIGECIQCDADIITGEDMLDLDDGMICECCMFDRKKIAGA